MLGEQEPREKREGSGSRSRVNSMRNGEASRVIENIDIETPKMDQE